MSGRGARPYHAGQSLKECWMGGAGCLRHGWLGRRAGLALTVGPGASAACLSSSTYASTYTHTHTHTHTDTHIPLRTSCPPSLSPCPPPRASTSAHACTCPPPPLQCDQTLRPGSLAAVIAHDYEEGGGLAPRTWVFCPDPLCLDSQPEGSRLPMWWVAARALLEAARVWLGGAGQGGVGWGRARQGRESASPRSTVEG